MKSTWWVLIPSAATMVATAVLFFLGTDPMIAVVIGAAVLAYINRRRLVGG